MSYSSIITETGVLVEAEKKDKDFLFTYSGWSFSDVQSYDTESGRTVFYCGKSPFSLSKADTLLNLLESENAFKAGTAVIRILTDAACNEKEISFTGAGSVILKLESETKFKALFLPENLFSASVAALNEDEKSRQIFWWKNPTLHGNPALRFSRSVLAYKIFTKRVPFPATDTVERNADILDKNYLPIEYCIENLDNTLTEKINSELELNLATVNRPGKKQKKSIAAKINENKIKGETDLQKAARASREYQKAMSVYPLDLLETSEGLSIQSVQEYDKKSADFMARKAASVKTKRQIRRNIPKIITISAVSIVLAVIIANTVKSNGMNGTSKGLTSEDTTELFFQAINNLDTILVDNIVKGKVPSRYSNMVSQIYVISKNRQAYGMDKGFLTPGKFMLFISEDMNLTNAGIYGITNLYIDGVPKNMDLQVPLKKDKPKTLTEESGIQIYSEMNSVKKAEYYVLHSEENKIFCEKHTDTITLTFIKDKWMVTDIFAEQEPVPVDTEEFFKDFIAALNEHNSRETALIALKSKYQWLPKIEALLIAQKKIDEENAEFARSFGITAQ